MEAVSVDTRNGCAGALFVALRGDRSDGHDYLEEAVSKGAAALLVSRERSLDAKRVSAGKPVFAAPDTLAALQELAAAYRRRVDPRVVAVTGTTGKTGTKDFISSILEKRYAVHATPGNLNNHIGLPLTILGMGGTDEVLVAEMGANHKNEIRRLCEIAAPEVGVVTNIGPGHLEFFGSLEGVARAKAELVESLPESGTAVLPADDEFFPFLAERARGAVVSFGFDEGADWRIEGLTKDKGSGHRFSLKGTEIELGRFGRHHALNAAAAASACSLFGSSAEEIAAGIAGTKIPDSRGVLYDIGGIIFIDDSYNSNPASLAAAVSALMEMDTEGGRWLVLGDMLELGERSLDLHRESGEVCGKAGVDGIITLGTESVELSRAAALQRKAPERISHFMDTENLAAYLNTCLEKGDIVLVKGSRGMRMEGVLETMEQLRNVPRRRVD
ncbi:MAG TPA: UDP-N-acetylmuramoyl-tripeptide--D-alanyl-D-alanine ligase [Candidatus Eisenbacteria bacterium]|uniref:UDP-N-acetylmuramoyl-tripeptide--D-alanyl-D-alanine ligase n=1 Tax=Eiseniibacteriota bacterium TaxID=2212470 RepID=A0A7V2AVN4_UNCEI|nr:UDP-N-acetylmuramoyl-tripeptide--D-alanyl-D-alanine ligase [Candidatus Eisenbacteria bacterium]